MRGSQIWTPCPTKVPCPLVSVATWAHRARHQIPVTCRCSPVASTPSVQPEPYFRPRQCCLCPKRHPLPLHLALCPAATPYISSGGGRGAGEPREEVERERLAERGGDGMQIREKGGRGDRWREEGKRMQIRQERGMFLQTDTKFRVQNNLSPMGYITN